MHKKERVKVIKPVDIQNKDFEKKLKGYDINEVDEFLDLVIRDYDMLYRENKVLKEKNLSLKDAVDRYKLMDVTIKQTVSVAQKNADEIIAAAKTEAQTIIEKAKLEAAMAQRDIDEEHIRKHHELLGLKTQIEEYKLKMRALSESIIKILE